MGLLSHGKTCKCFEAMLLFFSFFLTLGSAQLSPSQSMTLFRLPRLLEYPPVLAGWSRATAFCYLPSSPYLSVSCSGNSVTGLTIVGDRLASPGAGNALSSNFSSDSLFVTLSKLPSLTTLSLVSLGLWGPLPGKVDRFSSLKVLNLSSNYLSGAIPPEIATMSSLQNLLLSQNSFNGTVPNLTSLTLLAELDLSGNHLGPDFPSLSTSLAVLKLPNNSFRSKIPADLSSFHQLQKLDLSYNNLTWLIPAFLFSLPSIQYLSLSHNKLNGQLPANVSCNSDLEYVDISANFLVGALPLCINSNSSNRVVLSSGNCLTSGDFKSQHPSSYCNDAALAAILPPANKISGSKSNLGLILGIAGGVTAGVVLVGLVAFLVFRRARVAYPECRFLQKPTAAKSSTKVAPRTPAEARHMSQAVRTGTLGMPPYRVFSMEELEEATYNFDPSNLVEDGPRGQFYKGWLQDGSMVLVRCLKFKQKLSTQSLLQYIEVISKLMHRHLVSILGHCVTSSQDGINSATTIFLVSEIVTNGSLRSHLTEWRKREMFKWPQRVATVIGVARGIQFLHTITVPGIVGNDLNIENILLDQTLTAKISNYNLPVLSKNKINRGGSECPFVAVEDGELGSYEHGEKEDIYQLGIILLEIITGKPANTKSELDSLRAQLQKSLTNSETSLKEMTDPSIQGTFALDSLRTAVELSLNCISSNPNKRPSIDDFLWNLQYSVQVQDGWASSENLSIQS